MEHRVALKLSFLVLAVLTAVKPIGGVPYLGAAAFTVAAGLQLYLPIWRCDRLGEELSAIGLHTHTWRVDLRLCGVLCLVFFPPYALLHHLYIAHAHDLLSAWGYEKLATWIPQGVFSPRLPDSMDAWLAAAWWLGDLTLTHVFGVALPEETFYRGYLQSRLEARWPPRHRVVGAPIGAAAVLACGLFALGHFLGEWDPFRLGPFIPAFLFAWQRNRTGSIVGAISFHAACNVFGQMLFALYAPR